MKARAGYVGCSRKYDVELDDAVISALIPKGVNATELVIDFLHFDASRCLAFITGTNNVFYVKTIDRATVKIVAEDKQ